MITLQRLMSSHQTWMLLKTTLMIKDCYDTLILQRSALMILMC